MSETNEVSPAQSAALSDLLCTNAIRKEADEHQTVFNDDRRRKQLFYAVADEIDRLRARNTALRDALEKIEFECREGSRSIDPLWTIALEALQHGT